MSFGGYSKIFNRKNYFSNVCFFLIHNEAYITSYHHSRKFFLSCILNIYGTVNVKDTTKEELSRMMVGRDISFIVDKKEADVREVVLSVKNLTVSSKTHKNNAVKNIPIVYCPEAPILNNPILNANPTARPVIKIGVAK